MTDLFTPVPDDNDCVDGFCPLPRTPEGDASASEDTATCDSPEVVQPNTMEMLLQEVLAEEDASDNEVVKELIRERLAEIRRLEDLLNNARRQLNELMAMDPKQIAHSAAVPPSLKGKLLQGKNPNIQFYEMPLKVRKNPGL